MLLLTAMADLADKLETPLAIYKYLYNNINTEYYNGSRKGALGTYEQNGGDDAAGKFFKGISKNPFFSEWGRGALYLFPEPESKNNVNTFFVSLPLEEANKKYKKGSNVKMGFNINDEIRELAKGIIKNANDFEPNQ